MKAAVITRYGSPDVIKILDAPKPAPGAGEVLIRVHATTVSRTDCGELRPRIIGRLIFGLDRKSTRLNSSHGYISYAVFCLKKKKTDRQRLSTFRYHSTQT